MRSSGMGCQLSLPDRAARKRGVDLTLAPRLLIDVGVKPLFVADVMTRGVVSLNQGHSIHLAASILRLKHIRHLPVTDDAGNLVGIVTHRDLIAAQADVLARTTPPPVGLSIPVARVMKMGVWTVHEDATVLETARIMADHKFGCVPVTRGRKLVGIVTEADLMRALLASLDARREGEDTVRIRHGG